MIENKTNLIRFLDGTILFFMVLFVLSLSNSIFVNQIGYFGALVFVLVRYAVTKENQFEKTDLESAFIIFIIAEFLSFLFSDYQSQAFNNLLKRIVLIPIIYTTIAATTDLKKGKLYFKLYIAGTLITVLIYLYFAYHFVIENLYGITQSGPSLFQYPITASEIISFTVIFLFAFLVNEKTSLKVKIFLLVSFLLSALALLSTYKRTGWMGAAFGLLVVLAMKKQWKILAAGLITIIIVFVSQKNYSEVKVFNFVNENKLNLLYSFQTEGAASDFAKVGDNEIISDYDDGLLVYKDSSKIKNVKLSGAVTSFHNWKDNYYLAYLMDTRFLVLKNNNLDFQQVGTLVSPGFTVAHKIKNGLLYVLDSDSGLTVFPEPLNPSKRLRFRQFANYKNFFVDSSIIVFASADSGFSVYELNERLPGKKLAANKKPNLEKFFYSSGRIIAAYPTGIYLYRFDAAGLRLLTEFKSINNVYRITEKNDGFLIIKINGEIYDIYKNETHDYSIRKIFQLNFTPRTAKIINNKLYCSLVKRSRLLSIFDPYLPSNFNRLALWRAGLKIFKDHPLFGVGDIDLANYYRKYKRDFDKEIQGHMHNNYVHFLVTLGSFGFLALMFLFYKIIRVDIKIINGTKTIPFVSSYAIGAFAAFCGFLVSGLTELNFWDQEITTLLWFTFGLNVILYKITVRKSNSQNKSG